MKTYDVTVSDGSTLKPITAYSPQDAAEVAAERLARRLGARGAVGALRWDSTSLEQNFFTYQAFIGRITSDGITGGNVWIYVTPRAKN